MDLKLPHLGEGADSGTVVNLFVKEGDQVAKDQPILELENEKAVATIPATQAGKVGKIYVKAGDKISVGQSILSLEGDEKAAIRSPAPSESKAAGRKRPDKEEPRDDRDHVEAGAEVEEGAEPSSKPGIDPAASPSIRKLARDLGIDLTRVRGSERGGRIVLADVKAYLQRLQRGSAAPKSETTKRGAEPKQTVEKQDFSKWGQVSRKPLSPLRQVIGRRMSESWNAVPRVTQFDEADITDLLALRKKHSDAFEKKGARLTLTSFALKVVVDTLKKHPMLNSSLDEAAQEIVIKEYYHIGVAVDTDAGLIVPVIRDVDKKGLLTLSKELEELAKKARERKVSGDELKGGTFTISNQGGIGGGHFTPIVNMPEVAILGLGRGSLKAVVRGDKIEARTMLPIGLSYDHRVIDGATAARFTVDLVKSFENFAEANVTYE
jgi:pyruvate dehydrogenase E2 component (dihydrolipoamide acetyltransferase)